MTVPTPQIRFDGPALEFCFPGLLIGAAEYEEGPTGLTVFHFPNGVMAAVDVRGGAAATINTDRLRLGYDQPTVRAIFFSGGSSYGLEAASGIMAELLALRGHATAWEMIPTVTGAVVFDFRGRNNAIHPDKELGRAALRAACEGRFPLGAHGAGRLVNVGKFFGPAFMESSGQVGDVKLAAFSVVNSVGVIVGRDGRVVRGNFDPQTAQRRTLAQDLNDGTAPRKRSVASAIAGPLPVSAIPENTTLTVVAVNQRLSYAQLSRLAIQTHTSMARGIQPFHTEKDGDVLYAVTTGEVASAGLEFEELASYAAELAWDAVLSAVPPL